MPTNTFAAFMLLFMFVLAGPAVEATETVCGRQVGPITSRREYYDNWSGWVQGIKASPIGSVRFRKQQQAIMLRNKDVGTSSVTDTVDLPAEVASVEVTVAMFARHLTSDESCVFEVKGDAGWTTALEVGRSSRATETDPALATVEVPTATNNKVMMRMTINGDSATDACFLQVANVRCL
jgi:hypothetical protein